MCLMFQETLIFQRTLSSQCIHSLYGTSEIRQIKNKGSFRLTPMFNCLQIANCLNLFSSSAKRFSEVV